MTKFEGPISLNDTGLLLAPSKSGVYLLTSGARNCVFYVGQANNLKERLRQHISSSENNACIRRNLTTENCNYFYILFESQSDRDKAEREYYYQYKPECNIQRP